MSDSEGEATLSQGRHRLGHVERLAPAADGRVAILDELAEPLGIDARALVVAVMFGASASFATPIGYQTNTLVYGAGDYRFSDFLKIGVPLNIIVGIAASAAIWIFFT